MTDNARPVDPTAVSRARDRTPAPAPAPAETAYGTRGVSIADRSLAIGVSTVDHRDDLDDDATFEDPVEDAVLASPC